MATQINTSVSIIPNTAVWITKDGKDINPMNTGRLGVFPIGTKIKINLCITEEHSCFTIDPNDPGKHLPKKNLGSGVYEKNITIINGDGQGLAPRWPNNVIGIDVHDRHFTIGIQQQQGIFYFIAEEYTQADDKYQPGQVKWFSALRGYGAVASENPFFDYKIHWSACPKRDNGFRYLNSGDKINWNPSDEVDSNGSSTFVKEIKNAELI